MATPIFFGGRMEMCSRGDFVSLLSVVKLFAQDTSSDKAKLLEGGRAEMIAF